MADEETTDPFSAYRLPPGVADGTWIALPGTPAKFLVRIPSRFNEEYQTAILREVNVEADGKINASTMQTAAQAAFRGECIIEAQGLPDGMDVGEFFDAYPLALRTLQERANEVASEADRRIEELLGKSESAPAALMNGRDSEKPRPSSPRRASRRAGPRPAAATAMN